jgi:hypothetical protein
MFQPSSCLHHVKYIHITAKQKLCVLFRSNIAHKGTEEFKAKYDMSKGRIIIELKRKWKERVKA